MAQVVQRLGNQFLASAGGSSHQHGLKVRRDPAQLRKDLQHRRASCNDSLKLVRLDQVVVELEGTSPSICLVDETGNELTNLDGHQGFAQYMAGTARNHLFSPRTGSGIGHEHHLHCQITTE